MKGIQQMQHMQMFFVTAKSLMTKTMRMAVKTWREWTNKSVEKTGL